MAGEKGIKSRDDFATNTMIYGCIMLKILNKASKVKQWSTKEKTSITSKLKIWFVWVASTMSGQFHIISAIF